MTLDHTVNIIKREIKRQGYEIVEKTSTSTNSVYFKLSNGTQTVLSFRVSDHDRRRSRNLMTLRFDKVKKESEVVGFVKNRLFGFRKRSMRNFYGM